MTIRDTCTTRTTGDEGTGARARKAVLTAAAAMALTAVPLAVAGSAVAATAARPTSVAPTDSPTATASPTTPAPSTPAPTTPAPTTPAPTVPPTDSQAAIPTTITLTGPAAVRPGLPGTVTTTVTASDGNPLAGTVELFDGSRSLGSTPLAAGGVNAIDVTLLTYGAHQVTAVFSPSTLAHSSSVSAPLDIVSNDVPSPIAIRAINSDRSALIVTLVPGDAHGSTITSYTVTCVAGRKPVFRRSAAVPTVRLTGLRNGVDYRCVAAATNAAGPGAFGPAQTGRAGDRPAISLTTTTPTLYRKSRVKLTGVVTQAGLPQAGESVVVTFTTPSSTRTTRVARATTDAKGAFTVSVSVVAKQSLFTAATTVGVVPVTSPELEIDIRRLTLSDRAGR